MTSWDTAIPYFPESELQCKGTGIIKLDIRFAIELPKLRKEWSAPLSPSSICRTPGHNTKVKGHPNSLHLTDNPTWPSNGTMAADITWHWWTKDRQLNFAKLAYELGWSVGLHVSFCHIDRRADLYLPNLPQNVFLYGRWDNKFNPQDIR